MAAPLPFPDMTFNPAARIDVRQIGTENSPLLVIDNVLSHPEQMVAHAAETCVFSGPPKGSYFPGLNARLPSAYGHALISALRPLLRSVFALPINRNIRYEGFFGLSTFPEGAPKPLQTIPHFDSCNPDRLAMVHYFCGTPFRGTAFYRHNNTGFEAITAGRSDRYRREVFAELKATPQARFVDCDGPDYSWIDLVDARFNRLAVYRSTVLHSALLNDTPLTSDVRTGRLTANSFIELV